ncbi:MAG: glutamine--fructose-6-phosphate transaminase (isomerizing) [Clostridiaceae bacterium]|nr:glutamine--fructose-6-phosphate transaminase (isomerizing) [Eubacteriales bacterium]
MCGIVGYVGSRQAAPLILDALEKLEYRGYDSSGLALAGNTGLHVFKALGRLSVLRERTKNGADLKETAGIGHTRWATHGEPSDVNSHPHLSHSGKVALVHNGIIENYLELRDFLAAHGYTFVSDTDTEIAVQLVDFFYKGDPVNAVREAVNLLVGSFALGIVFEDHPDMLVAVRKDSPLIVGLGKGENFIASDVPAILSHTREVIRLNEYEFAVLTSRGVSLYDRYGERVEKAPEHISWDAGAAEKGGYPHFMLKEIMEQPAVIKSTLGPHIHKSQIDLGLKRLTDEDLKNVDRVYIVACGSAYHVGFIGKTCIEKLVRIPVSAELASEFRYSDPLVTENTLTIVISQSGETIDTLFAMREAKKRGSRILSVVNVVGSTIAAESEEVMYTRAGPEIAVATTKAYSAQLTVLYLIALKLASVKGRLSDEAALSALSALNTLPELTEALLGGRERIQYLASLFFDSRDIFFIGRNLDYALALEGSLKLKEISYIHSDAYAAGELKHGTISLIEKGTLVVALCTYAPLREKMLGNIREVKARGATVIALATEDAASVKEAADYVIWLPKCDELILPSLSVLPLQLFAYYMALLKGCDIDKPRNLAKSVTVE